MLSHFFHVLDKCSGLLTHVAGDFHKPHATVPVGFTDDGADLPALELGVYFNCVTDCEHDRLLSFYTYNITPASVKVKHLIVKRMSGSSLRK